jgi:hypothetical protein
MRRLAVSACLLAVIATACGGTSSPPPATSAPASPSPSSSPSPSPSFSSSPSPTSAPSPELQLPPDAPTTFDRPLAPGDFTDGDLADLVPPGATVASTWTLARPDDPFDQIALAWQRGDDPFASEHGFVVWRRSEAGPPWRAVYAFTDDPDRQVLGVSFMTDDLTGDGVDDVLTFEDTGGSGGCGTYRVISSSSDGASGIFEREVCDTQIRPEGGDLVVHTAVYGPDDPHCCPSRYRTTTLRWNGETWDVVDRQITPD